MCKKIMLLFIVILLIGKSGCAVDNTINYILVQKNMLKSWEFYKKTYISDDGRVIDHERGSITTSEGQSYAMLRALIIDDRDAFDLVYNWTKNNLGRKTDNLFAWLWGNNNGIYEIIDPNTATDADVDIAYSLILASKKWNKDEYLNDAKKIINDIWQLETIDINNKRILTSGVEQTKKDIIDINPSYFAPYAFKLFAQYDSNNWIKLVDDNYEIILKVIEQIPSRLPPDWFFIDKNGNIVYENIDLEKMNFSYDAVRVFIRVYLDYIHNKDERAIKIIKHANFFVKQYQKTGKCYTNIKTDGTLKDKVEALSAIAMLIPAISCVNSDIARKMYMQKIMRKYNSQGYWGNKKDYYSQNLVWFGVYIFLDGIKFESKKY